jgi:hypothetical protein
VGVKGSPAEIVKFEWMTVAWREALSLPQKNFSPGLGKQGLNAYFSMA